MEEDSISTAAAGAILALLVGREVEIRGEFGAVPMPSKRETLDAGGITVRKDDVREWIVVRLEFGNAAVEMWDTSTGGLFRIGPDGLWCSMGMGDITITACPPEAVST